MSQEIDLLNKLFDFYNKRYSKSKSTMEDKFNDAIVDLIQTGDIKKPTYYEFCVDHDIEPRKIENAAPRQVPTYTPPPNYGYDPCRGGGYTRSHC